MRLAIKLLIPLLSLTACQKPASLSIPGFSKTPEAQRREVNLKLNKTGLEEPTWELTKQKVTEIKWPRMRDSYTHIKTDKKVIAITFDDGPHRVNTPRLLKMLKDRDIRATFYVVGNMVRNNPQILRRMIADGHEIGNHTVTHPNLARMTNDHLMGELNQAHKQILAATGVPPRTIRPPSGAIKNAQRQLVGRQIGCPIILWSCDPQDWKRPGADVVAQRLIAGANPGGILLCHDLHKATVDAMPETLDALLADGYQFVTISQLIAMDEGD